MGERMWEARRIRYRRKKSRKEYKNREERKGLTWVDKEGL